MHWEIKKIHVARFIAIFALLQWSETGPAVISKVCLNGDHILQKKAMLIDEKRLLQGRKASNDRIRLQYLV